MRSRKGFTLIELLVVIAIIAILAAILFPVFMRAKAAALASHCQSNMSQLGKAVKQYLQDWEDTFPTNHTTGSTSLAGVVVLSDPTKLDPNTQEPIRFQNGVNWVESLYPYVEKVSQGDAAAVWKCPAAKTSQAGSPFAAVTYGFNCYLCEITEGALKNAGNTLMIRELDRLHDAVLKPRPIIPPDITQPPLTPFLNSRPDSMGVTRPNYNMHNGGSEMLFTDGHVKMFTPAYYPYSTNALDVVWDSTTGQWFNNGGTDTGDPKYHAIAVTP